MSLFIQSLVNGLNQGAIYALIALGYTMVYGIIRMINFAHGDFIMVGSYTLFYTIPLMISHGMPAWLAVVAAVAVCGSRSSGRTDRLQAGAEGGQYVRADHRTGSQCIFGKSGHGAIWSKSEISHGNFFPSLHPFPWSQNSG